MSRLHVLTEAAVMVALAFILSNIAMFQLPWGGSITMFSTLPIVVFSLRHSTKWGVGMAAVYSLTQLLQGFNHVLYGQTFYFIFLCTLLDYLLAYTAIGLTGAIARLIGKKTAGIAAATVLTGLMRLLCSFLSGILIWSSYAPEGTPVWIYSLSYNASWLLPDLLPVVVAVVLLSRVKALHLTPSRAY